LRVTWVRKIVSRTKLITQGPMSREGTIERRLAAILAADVAGYSRLMGQDEGCNAKCTQGSSP
jgi:class 3 adenylate cyclase